MLSSPNPMNVLDFCNDFGTKIKVDSNYQRSDKVWPEQARGYLIESILLGYPIPKLFLHQKIDIKSKQSVKFIVDGQQRSTAIHDYFVGKFAISRKSECQEIAGKKFNELSEEYQNVFLSYSLPIDLFVTATREEIIETFRRINSYTVPLNAEEKRHANYQGEAKWFIHTLTTKYSEKLTNLGVFTEKNLARMVDYKFFTELSLFIDQNDVTTSTVRALDGFYKRYDKSFANAVSVFDKITLAVTSIQGYSWIKNLNISKQYFIQMVLYAIATNETNVLQSEDFIKERLSLLSEAIESNDQSEFKSFVDAASKTTNDGGRKKLILRYMKWALYNESI